ncbi:cupin domain-containing protein [Tahibacter amnicola]|uniref:Cupin domain-containing protein n=1 Tax=Tahibacter amnicola TaxID=2976241 RepID=A0ABY6BKQ6_9GAMM|nr:cupin domain-containing protein [Tahibacter amnicola]UXI70057.1 cupin domain-containing protein [Tahibacter amnicola]
MNAAVNARSIAAALTDLWSPRVVAEVDDAYVKVARIQGVLDWHTHADEDELFLVLAGELRLRMHAGDVVLREGDLYVVPKGVAHSPLAESECLVLLVERKSTLHTGSTVTAQTRSIEEQLRAFSR